VKSPGLKPWIKLDPFSWGWKPQASTDNQAPTKVAAYSESQAPITSASTKSQAPTKTSAAAEASAYT
jgi:hypothetical protein